MQCFRWLSKNISHTPLSAPAAEFIWRRMSIHSPSSSTSFSMARICPSIRCRRARSFDFSSSDLQCMVFSPFFLNIGYRGIPYICFVNEFFLKFANFFENISRVKKNARNRAASGVFEADFMRGRASQYSSSRRALTASFRLWRTITLWRM